MSDTITLTLTEPCQCGGISGYITPTGTQDVLRCCTCDKYQKNISRADSGRRRRTLSTREGITPSQRARVLSTHGNACIYCGKRPPEVRPELEHMVPRDLAAKYGLLDDLIDSLHNLAPACPECNSGKRHVAYTARSVAMMVRSLRMAALVADREHGAHGAP